MNSNEILSPPGLGRRHAPMAAGSTPEPGRRYATLPHNLVSRTSSAPSPTLQRRISTNTASSSYLKGRGRRFNVQLKKGLCLSVCVWEGGCVNYTHINSVLQRLYKCYYTCESQIQSGQQTLSSRWGRAIKRWNFNL